MLPGQDYIYKCPKCGNLISNRSLMSGNTFDAKYYSDAKMIAPFLPDFPNLTKCNKCNEIFWLRDLTEIGTRDRSIYIEDLRKDPWEDAQDSEFLSVDDLYRALDSEACNNEGREFNIRMYIWRAYNDRIRKGEDIFMDSNDEILWKENCR